MDITINPSKLSGEITIIPSKSQAHRLLICAAFSDRETFLQCPETNQDIEATAECLRALGAIVQRYRDGYKVSPITKIPCQATLPCHESGSTLRFMLPIVGALGIDATFLLEGRLPSRPLSPLWEEMVRMGCTLYRTADKTLHCCGQLQSGDYTIDGGVSSQFITGLLFAMALIPGYNTLTITGKLESAPYVKMTLHALQIFGIDLHNYRVNGGKTFISPGKFNIEGDWSNGAFFLTANKLGSSIKICGLNDASSQGDKAIASILPSMDRFICVDVSHIPDLVPILSVAGAYQHGIRFTNVERLRLKESDRVATVAAMMEKLGVKTDIKHNELTISKSTFHSCTIDAAGDHRIAMAAAIAATAADGPVTILGADCVSKSYPAFWDVYKKLGGSYEQYLR